MRAMSPLPERLAGFAAALRDPAVPVPPGLLGPDRRPSAKRFAVYRNNVVTGLVDALQQNFPAVCRLVGEEFFREMARLYVLSAPPASSILLHYGTGFPDFVAGFEPAAPLPYLADVARIERAWLESYHAADAAPLDAAHLSGIAGDRVADARFALHPSLRVVVSQFPALTIWRMNVADGVPGAADLDAGENTLVVRPAFEVEVHPMPPGGPEFVAALATGATMTDAARAAMGADPQFDLAGNIADLIAAGAFVDYLLAGEPDAVKRPVPRGRATGH